jgi:hypothetical protein
MHAAFSHIQKYPSKADNTGTDVRTATHLAQRTINSMIGAQEWSMNLMTHALVGNTSHITTDSYRYFFAHANVTYCSKMQHNTEKDLESNSEEGSGSEDESDAPTQTTAAQEDPAPVGDDNDAYVDELLASALTAASATSNLYMRGHSPYKINGDETVFLSQEESYDNRGAHFKAYNAIEFAMTVDLVPKRKKKAKPKTGAGRPPRHRFLLGEQHKLFSHYDAVLRAKQHTPMLGGGPTPKYPGTRPSGAKKRRQWYIDIKPLAEFLIDMLVPWKSGEPLTFSRDGDGLMAMFDQWDRSTATLINRQRFRYAFNIVSKLHRRSSHEQLAREWRARNRQVWDKGFQPSNGTFRGSAGNRYGDDDEAAGRLSQESVLEVTQELQGEWTRKRLKHVAKLTATVSDMFDKSYAAVTEPVTAQPPVVHVHDHTSGVPVREVNKLIPTMHLEDNEALRALAEAGLNDEANDDGESDESDCDDDSDDDQMSVSTSSPPETVSEYAQIKDPLECSSGLYTPDMYADLTAHLTPAQKKTVEDLASGNDQQLIALLSGGGTGKSEVIKTLSKVLKRAGLCMSTSAPTGVAASQLPGGRTFHSTFAAFFTELNASNTLLKMKEALGGEKLKVCVIDELSMLDSKFLALADKRLRSMYNTLLPFGGISMLLAGDFCQLQVRLFSYFTVYYIYIRYVTPV